MVSKLLKIMSVLGFSAVVLVLSRPAQATLNLVTQPGYSVKQISEDAAGGFDFLCDGNHIIGVTAGFSGAYLYIMAVDIPTGHGRVHAIGGASLPGMTLPTAPTPIPVAVGPQVIGSVTAGNYGSFVRVSPDCTFALYGETGATNPLIKIDLTSPTYPMTVLTQVSGNHDLEFLDNDEIIISANTNFGPTNDIVYINLNNPSTQKIIGQFLGVPSGALGVNKNGDVYYIESTYAFPAPANSHAFYKFSKAQVQNAIATSTLLQKNNGQLIGVLDGGYSMGINNKDATGNILIGQLNGVITRFDEAGNESVFSTTPNPPTNAFCTHVRFANEDKTFVPFSKSQAKLGVVCTDAVTFEPFFILYKTK